MITATNKGKYYDVEYSIVNVSELERELRIDAEYYEPVYLYQIKKIISKNWMPLKKLLKEPISNGFDYRYFEEVGTPYIRVGDIKDFVIYLENAVRVNPIKKPKKILLEIGDILLTRKGTVGEVSIIYSEKLRNIIISSEIMKLRPNSSKINPYYLMVFLKSYFGEIQISQNIHGIAHVSITQEALENLKISIPSDTFQKFIEKLVLKAYEERQKAEQFYKQAEEILLEELGLKNWKPKTKKTKIGGQEFKEEENISIRTLSNVIKADRMDAEYWEPKYDEIEEMIKSFEYEKLCRLASNSYETFNPKTCDYFYYLEIANVDLVTGNYELKKLPCASAPSRAKKIVDEKDILISTVRPNRNAVAFVIRKDKDPFVASTGFCKLKVMDERILPEYLFVLFKTDLYRELLIRKTTATMYPAVSENDIMQLDIPILPMDIQEHIRDLVMIGFQSRENSKKLLEIAKKTVEIYIEKDEEEGLNYARNKLNELNIEIK